MHVCSHLSAKGRDVFEIQQIVNQGVSSLFINLGTDGNCTNGEKRLTRRVCNADGNGGDAACEMPLVQRIPVFMLTRHDAGLTGAKIIAERFHRADP